MILSNSNKKEMNENDSSCKEESYAQNDLLRIAYRRYMTLTFPSLCSLINYYRVVTAPQYKLKYNHFCFDKQIHFTYAQSLLNQNTFVKKFILNHPYSLHITSQSKYLPTHKLNEILNSLTTLPYQFTSCKNQIFDCIKTISVIFLQKHIRGFLIRKPIYDTISSLIISTYSKHIIIIQTYYRRHLAQVLTHRFALITAIIRQRQEHYERIYNLLRKYYIINLRKKQVIVSMLFDEFSEKVITLQNAYMTHYMCKQAKKIIEKEKKLFVLTYPFYAKGVSIKILMNSTMKWSGNNIYRLVKGEEKEYEFEYCPIRKLFVLGLKKEEMKPGNYVCQFMVDGDVTCDGRFKYIFTEQGEYWNIIRFGNSEFNFKRSLWVYA